MDITIESRRVGKGIRGLRELYERLEVLREVRSEMPIQTASVLLAIAMRPGILQRDLPDVVGISQSSVSRNINALSAWDRHDKPGLGLVTQKVGPRGARSPELHLTKAGKDLVKRLASGSIAVR